MVMNTRNDADEDRRALNESNDSASLAMIQQRRSPSMQTFTANEAKTHFGEFIDRAQREPIRVTRRNRVVGIMVSPSDYEAMRVFYADRLRRTLDQTAAHATAQGLTQQQLETLLADDS